MPMQGVLMIGSSQGDSPTGPPSLDNWFDVAAATPAGPAPAVPAGAAMPGELIADVFDVDEAAC